MSCTCVLHLHPHLPRYRLLSVLRSPGPGRREEAASLLQESIQDMEAGEAREVAGELDTHHLLSSQEALLLLPSIVFSNNSAGEPPPAPAPAHPSY